MIFDFQFISNVSLLLTTVAMSGHNQMYKYCHTIMVPNHNTNCITLCLTTLIEQHAIYIKFYDHHIIIDHKLYTIHCLFIVPIYSLTTYLLHSFVHSLLHFCYTFCYTFCTFFVHFYYTFVHTFASVSKGVVRKCTKWFTESVKKVYKKFYKGCTGNVQKSALESV